jgi:WS/DGAT/MGAT family acyltransferase
MTNGGPVAEAMPLDAEDARILALETGSIRGHTVKVLLVEDAPGPSAVSELGAAIEANLAKAPRWRQRLVPAPGTPAGLSWQDDPAFRIEAHVRAIRGGEPADEPTLRSAIAQTMMDPLDREQALWSLDVIPRLADGRWALIWKVHHCLADGTTAMRIGSNLIWTEEAPTNGAAATVGRSRPRTAGRRGAGSRLAAVAGYRGLFLREFSRTPSLSQLAAEVGPHRRVAFARCPLEDLHALGRAIGPKVTINDVLLSVVSGALRQWLLNRGAPAAAMKVQVPVSMHTDPATDEQGANRDSFLLVKLPISESDPVARVRSLNSATQLRKNRHDARAIYAIRQRISRAPRPLRRAVQQLVQGPHEYSLNVSNVPGPPAPIRVLGHRVDELYSIAEVAPRHALRVAAVSLTGSLFIGLCADADAVPDVDVIAAGIPLSIDELRERVAV